jgi:hypothetical protein
VDTRGWMGGVSKRAASNFKPGTSICTPGETSLKNPRSLACKCMKGYTSVEGLSSLSYPGLVVLPGFR